MHTPKGQKEEKRQNQNTNLIILIISAKPSFSPPPSENKAKAYIEKPSLPTTALLLQLSFQPQSITTEKQSFHPESSSKKRRKENWQTASSATKLPAISTTILIQHPFLHLQTLFNQHVTFSLTQPCTSTAPCHFDRQSSTIDLRDQTFKLHSNLHLSQHPALRASHHSGDLHSRALHLQQPHCK